jgi:aconitate hydratase
MDKLAATLAGFRKTHAERPLTYCEKVLLSHLVDPAQEALAGQSDLYLRADHLLTTDIASGTTLLQFMLSGREKVATPTSLHCDHFIVHKDGQEAEKDVEDAWVETSENYRFVRKASAKYGLEFWGPNTGIVHHVVLDHYAAPGMLIVGTDSHTPSAGGLGAAAIGVGGADAVDVMVGLPLELRLPKVIGVHLTGQLSGWVTAKDIILHVVGLLGTAGATGCAIEYFGAGVQCLSVYGMASICNMGAETGATFSLFPYSAAFDRHLRATGRGVLADKAAEHAKDLLTADPGCHYDRVVEVDLSKLVPLVNGPLSPDRAMPAGAEVGKAAVAGGWPEQVSAVLVGSCTNGAPEDIAQVAEVIKQGLAHGNKVASRLLVTPGTAALRSMMDSQGLTKVLREAGAEILSNSCGPCIGMWKRQDKAQGELNTIVHTFNRNFAARSDGNPKTMAFITSPMVAAAIALTGRLSFNPATDDIIGADGKPWRLEASNHQEVERASLAYNPSLMAPEVLPPDVGQGDFEFDEEKGLIAPIPQWPAWSGSDITLCPVLAKVVGKCTTDHITPAGAWLRLHNHVHKFSSCFLIGAKLADGSDPHGIAPAAKKLKAAGTLWTVVGDRNYGEGSSRECAAIVPRYLGCAAVVARSFARIHESNLKKQGILALTFADPADYDRIQMGYSLSLLNLAQLAPKRPVQVLVTPPASEGISPFQIQTIHSLNEAQIEWFRQGSALNVIAKSIKKASM